MIVANRSTRFQREALHSIDTMIKLVNAQSSTIKCFKSHETLSNFLRIRMLFFHIHLIFYPNSIEALFLSLLFTGYLSPYKFKKQGNVALEKLLW